MKILQMNKYGAILTGREFGSDIMKKILNELELPVILDFKGVISMGSSFADEVIIPIAKKQNNTLKIANASDPVWACIEDIAKDTGVDISKN